MGRALAPLAFGLAALGCTAPTTTPPPVAWIEQATVVLDAQGQSEPMAIAVPAADATIAVRATPLGDAPICWRLEGDGCAACSLPSPQRDAALLVLDAAALPPLLILRARAYDCELDVRISRARAPSLPERVRFETVAQPVLPTAGRLALRLAVLERAALPRTVLEGLLAVARDRFAAVGIELVLEREQAVFASPPTIAKATDAALRAFDAAVLTALAPDPADRRFVPVVLAPCVRTVAGQQPEGLTSHVPGSAGTGVSLIIVSTGCEELAAPPGGDATRAGLVLAHEIGHHLGLFHADTPTGAAQTGGVAGRMMDTYVGAVPLEEAWFSAQQGTVLRRHPDVY